MTTTARQYSSAEENIRQAHIIRQRLMRPQNAFKPQKPVPVLTVVHRAPEAPLWRRQPLSFDAHVLAYQWHLAHSRANRAQEYIKARCIELGADYAKVIDKQQTKRDVIEAVAVMYDWAIKRKHVKTNPARGIESVYVKGDGAIPWKAADLKAYLATHKPGSKAHVALSLLVWTGCRIEDTTLLGRKHECVIDGVEALRWVPSKKGSSEVCLPLLPPLKAATRAPKVQGETYLLGRGGKPYASGDSASNMFKRWCVAAGIGHLSAHGVRKGLAEILAEQGCSQYEIMAILGHSEAKTSEVYTRRVERWKLALGAMERVNVSHAWG
ncbi:UNVERIFIED_ORG: integrase [Rhizobium esperanzae]